MTNSSSGEKKVTGLEVKGVKENDIFVVGDDEDDEDEPGEKAAGQPLEPAINATSEPTVTAGGLQEVVSNRYFIKRGDTLLGIALKFGVDVRLRPETQLFICLLMHSLFRCIRVLPSAASTTSP